MPELDKQVDAERLREGQCLMATYDYRTTNRSASGPAKILTVRVLTQQCFPFTLISFQDHSIRCPTLPHLHIASTTAGIHHRDLQACPNAERTSSTHAQARIGRLFVAIVQWYHFQFSPCGLNLDLRRNSPRPTRRCDCFAPRPRVGFGGETRDGCIDEG